MQREFDVLVVGAGPSGSACALHLAKNGVNVHILEMGRHPGEKNVSGCIVYGSDVGDFGLKRLVPDFEATAPLERKISSHEVHILSSPNEKKGSYREYTLSGKSLASRFGLFSLEFETGHDFTVIRSQFDGWLANLAVEAGAALSTETTVLNLLKEDGSVVGVSTPKGELRAKLVVDCSGVTSTLVESAGLRGALVPRELYHGIKHVYRLGADKIDERLRLKAGNGRALTYLGDFMLGINGNAFIYPNRDTLSLGIVASMDSMIRATTEHFDRVGKLLDALDAFESHPMVRELLQDAELLEFSAHNIPKGFTCLLKRPYASGYLAAGDALGAFVKIGPMVDGMRYAIASGMMAAQTYLAAAVSGSFREKNLSRYRDLLTPVYEDVNRSGRDSFISESGFVYRTLPRLLFGSKFLSHEVEIKAEDASRGRVRHGTDAFTYVEGGGHSQIGVNVELASRSVTKPWIPSCPANCFTLTTPGGSVSSFRDLFRQNLDAIGGGHRRKALDQTMRQVAEGKLAFDSMGCVECGACRAIGPKDTIGFRYESRGRGVSYSFG
ncbi:MAG TPA: FAD-dependent oxidoreductase [Nitrososphaerales archaeon]|nr:FAD-dependent oxidoreductase [Nitrososphaerales archaeon]